MLLFEFETAVTLERYYAPPAICVAEFVLKYLGRAYGDYKVIALDKSAVEVALFGWCHITKKHHIFHYYPEENDCGDYVIKLKHHTDLEKKSFVYLGDERDNMTHKIKEAFDGEDKPNRPLSRIPQYIIEEHIQDTAFTLVS